MKGDIIYIKGVQKDEPSRGDDIFVKCGTENTWCYKEVLISKFHCRTEKDMRYEYAEKGLSAYTTDELLEEIKRRINESTL